VVQGDREDMRWARKRCRRIERGTEALAFWNEMMNPFVSRVCCMELPIAIYNH
jgi:hypothetical protein